MDAYRRVPVQRLLDVFFKWLPCPRLRAFLRMVLPAQSRAVGGIKQGGPLSALALEVYLTHFLHAPWRKAGHIVRLLRYADDLLLVAVDEAVASAADVALRTLLTPTGMLLKHTFEDARRDIRTEAAEWLGFRFRLHRDQFRIGLGSRSFSKLDRRFTLAHSQSRPSDRVVAVLEHWVEQLGPCYRRERCEALCKKAIRKAQDYGFEETLPVLTMTERWEDASGRWEKTRSRVPRDPGYLVDGPLAFPTPTSEVW
jgi:hypothetical protein